MFGRNKSSNSFLLSLQRTVIMCSNDIDGFNIVKWTMLMMEVKQPKDTSGRGDGDSSNNRLVPLVEKSTVMDIEGCSNQPVNACSGIHVHQFGVIGNKGIESDSGVGGCAGNVVP